MGLFSAHRRGTTSKQRAIALTSVIAERLLDPTVIRARSGEFDCICLYGQVINRELRLINKAGKNWRLGGRQLPGKEFANLDSKDFALIRSVPQNDGSHPVLLTFVGRRSQRLIQAGLAATLAESLHQSMAVFDEDSDEFASLADLFPPVPARVAMRSVGQQPALV
jgi:hypothetical protein